jgi:hypothetical protein
VSRHSSQTFPQSEHSFRLRTKLAFDQAINQPITKTSNLLAPIQRIQVGNMPTAVQDRSHFGLWVIMSSPLILSFPINMPRDKQNSVLQLVSNEHAVGVNQAWAGHPGTLSHVIHPPTLLYPCIEQIEIWTKPLPENRIAMLIVNHNEEKCKPFRVETPTATIMSGIDWGRKVGADVFDVWAMKEGGSVGVATSPETHSDYLVEGHDSVFLVLTPKLGESGARLQ